VCSREGVNNTPSSSEKYKVPNGVNVEDLFVDKISTDIENDEDSRTVNPFITSPDPGNLASLKSLPSLETYSLFPGVKNGF
jgi:hypothetical protein